MYVKKHKEEQRLWLLKTVLLEKSELKLAQLSTNRIQYSTVTSCDPQNSNLGLLLFLKFMNDLPNKIETQSKRLSFTDDLKIFGYIISTLNCQRQFERVRVVQD